ncbi:hypothetical protein KGF57_001946 [Candida theae]|uniref:DNA-binding protein REB1 n=1 Tax=Candida theae TaxID=1198502 RepID=A0AAD5FZG5_9ASCO|nr:uncharacterized protein KGF57_001946 [Candida theae]KAI5960475.1 hypothetical protein KGF57_001946 [Candida theae]
MEAQQDTPKPHSLRISKPKKRTKNHDQGRQSHRRLATSNVAKISSNKESSRTKKRRVDSSSYSHDSVTHESMIDLPNRTNFGSPTANQLERAEDIAMLQNGARVKVLSSEGGDSDQRDIQNDFSSSTSEKLSKRQQERLLTAANAMVEEEEMVPTYVGNEKLLPEGIANEKTSVTNVHENLARSPSIGVPSNGNSGHVGSPELPKHSYDGISDIDDLILKTSQTANKWFEEKIPKEKRGKPRPFVADEDAIIDYYLAGFCHFKKWDRNDLCNRIWTTDRTKDKFWKKVCKAIPYRTKSSIYKHIRRRYHIFDVRAKWSPEDDEKLRNLSVAHEGQWKTIGEILGRMPEDCRDRWRNYIKCGPGRTLQKWTSEEENKLIIIVNEMLHSIRSQGKGSEEKPESKINWTVVSERMDGKRSRIQCRYKWNSLNAKKNMIEAPKMSIATKLWLLQKVLKKYPNSLESIKWHKVMKSYEKSKPDYASWTRNEFEDYLSSLTQQQSGNFNFRDLLLNEINVLKSR